MLTKDQEKWIAHLSTTDKVKIIPYNPEVKKAFNKIKKEIKLILGNKIRVCHRGATSLKISGQGEVDLYIPVTTKKFNFFLKKLSLALENPHSLYPLERARFIRYAYGIKIEIFLINQSRCGWKDGIAFENFLKKHPRALEDYRILKEKADGESIQNYYRKKIEFINKILNKISP